MPARPRFSVGEAGFVHLQPPYTLGHTYGVASFGHPLGWPCTVLGYDQREYRIRLTDPRDGAWAGDYRVFEAELATPQEHALLHALQGL